MANYARIINGVAVDVSATPNLSFHPTVAAEFTSVPSKVGLLWRVKDDVWTPPAEAVITPVSTTVTFFSRLDFKRLFTGAERVAIAEARKTDAMIEDFFSIAEDPDSLGVDLTLRSTLDALQHLVDVQILTVDRRAAILAGQLQ